MNKFISLLIFCTISLCCKQASQDYIEIRHIGIEQKPARQLFITKEKLNIKINQDQLRTTKDHFEALNERAKKDMLDLYYDYIITDNKTFIKAIHYISHNNLLKQKSDTTEKNVFIYSIIINGEEYNLLLKDKRRFFNGMINFLVANKCDKRTINVLKAF